MGNNEVEEREKEHTKKAAHLASPIGLQCGLSNLQKRYHHYQRSKSVTGRKINTVEGGGETK